MLGNSLADHPKWSQVDDGYHVFIGRFQPLHKGHIALFDSVLEEGGKILILIMRTDVNQRNPFSLQERLDMFNKVYPREKFKQQVRIGSIPPVLTINVGRKCGYKLRRLNSMGKEEISATRIRDLVRAGLHGWRVETPPQIHKIIRDNKVLKEE